MSDEHDRGEWIPWYCEDSPGWLELSLAARGAAEGISRKMGRKRGELHLGSRGLRGLAVLLRCTWEELEPAIHELTSGKHPRFVVTDDERMLIDPGHASRQLKGSTRRMFEKRAKADSEPPSQPVTERHNPSPTVTPSLLISSDLKSDLGSRESTPSATPPDWWDSTCDTVEMATGEKFNRGAAWLRYSGHRRKKREPISQPDAQQFLVSVDVKERRQERQREQVTRDISKQRDEARAPKPEPVWRPPADDANAATPEQHRQFAEELQRRLAGAGR